MEVLVLLFSLWFALVSSQAFWTAALAGRTWQEAATWSFAGVVLAGLVSLNAFVIGLVANRWTVKPVLALLAIAAAMAGYYITNFGVVLDPGMLRNVLKTETKEAADLIGWPLWRQLLVAAGPLLLVLGWVRLAAPLTSRQGLSRERDRDQGLSRDRGRAWSLARGLGRRVALLVAALAVCAGSLAWGYQDLASLFRNQREARYLVTPLNVVYSASRALIGSRPVAVAAREPVGTDVRFQGGWKSTRRPILLFVVVGETARAANWGLNGYARQTTPELATLDVVNFSQVTSCGSDTETSLPCLFSPGGRRAYDEKKIRSSQSLLHVLARAGFDVQWRDNQTGCKGVCDGLPYRQVDQDQIDCQPGQCPDEKLLTGLEAGLTAPPGKREGPGRVIVMHQIGNHGPAYFRRYPAAFRSFTPACESADLRECPVESIVNAYDNALRYTDHVLAESIRMLERLSDRYDTGLLYVSDHGESLGERGLFLHGIPYAIAPEVQTRVPMLLWLSPQLARATEIDINCLKQQRERALTHDYVFSTLLGLLDLDTSVRDPAFDLTAGCRPAPGELDAADEPGHPAGPTLARADVPAAVVDVGR